MSKLLIGYVGIPKLSTMTDEDIKALEAHYLPHKIMGAF